MSCSNVLMFVGLLGMFVGLFIMIGLIGNLLSLLLDVGGDNVSNIFNMIVIMVVLFFELLKGMNIVFVFFIYGVVCVIFLIL